MKCDAKIAINKAAESEIKFMRADAYNHLGFAIGIPFSRASQMARDGYSKHDVKLEKLRYKAHLKLFNYLSKKAVEFANNGKYQNSVEEVITAMVQVGMEQFGPLFDLASVDFRKIMGIQRYYKKLFSAKVPSKLSKWKDTIVDPLRVVAARDKTGFAIRDILKAKTLFDDRLKASIGYINEINATNDALKRNVGEEDFDSAHELVRDLSDGRKRYIIPMRIVPEKIRKLYFKAKKLDSHTHTITDMNGEESSYTVFRVNARNLDKEVIGRLPADRGDVVSGNVGVWLAVRSDGGTENNLREGFYDAVEDKELEKELIRNTDRRKKVYKDFRYMRTQPKKSRFRREGDSASIWSTVAEQKNILRKIAFDLRSRHEESRERFKVISKAMIQKFGAEEAKKRIDDIMSKGDENSMIIINSETGDIETPYVFLRTAREDEYDPVMYESHVYLDLLKAGIEELKFKSLQATTDEEAEAYKEARDVLQDKFDIALGFKEADPRSINRLNSGIHAKSRVYFTNRMLRRKDPEVLHEYVNTMFKAAIDNSMKINLLETVLATDDITAEFVVDHASVAMGSITTRGGFLGIKYGNDEIANALSKIFAGTDVKITPEIVHRFGLFHNQFIISNNLGFRTAMTNNFQRTTRVIDFGLKSSVEANRIRRNGYAGLTPADVDALVRRTGVLDPITYLADMLTSGVKDATDADFIMPYVDMKRLLLPRIKFVNGKDGWDRLLEKSALRQKNKLNALSGKRELLKLNRKELEEIKKKKGSLYDLMNKEMEAKEIKAIIRSLELDLTEAYINRLVSWKLKWFPAGKSLTTMMGTEEAMRVEDAITGFLAAERNGLIPKDLPMKEKWMSPNAVRMARLVVYNSSFGMSSQFLPKMFHGAIGKWFFQFKSYQWHQANHDWKYFDNFINSSRGSNFVVKGLDGSIRLTAELARMIGRPIIGKKTKDVEANKLLRFLMYRGTASLLSLSMFYVPFFGWALQNAVRVATMGRLGGRRAIRGMESPVLMYPLRAMYMAYLLNARFADDDDKDRTTSEFIRDWLPPLMNVFIGFFIEGLDAIRPLLPFYGELRSGYDAITKATDKR